MTNFNKLLEELGNSKSAGVKILQAYAEHSISFEVQCNEVQYHKLINYIKKTYIINYIDSSLRNNTVSIIVIYFPRAY